MCRKKILVMIFPQETWRRKVREVRRDTNESLFMCEDCKNKTCLETGTPCEEVEKILKKHGIYRSNYIRKRQDSPFETAKIEGLAWVKVLKIKYGINPKESR